MASPRFLDPSSIPLKQQSGGNIWATLVPVLQWAILFALVAVVGLLFLPVIQAENQHKAQNATLLVQIAKAQDHQTQLELETRLMKDDPPYIEHVARDRLNMGKPGETILRFDKYQSSTSGDDSDSAW